MGCVVALLAWLSPRFALFLLYLFTDRLELAMPSFVVGFLGFILLPYTTVFYALAYAPIRGISGFGYLLVAAGFFMDLASLAGGGREARNRRA